MRLSIDKGLKELFEEQAALAPGAVAVRCGSDQLSYGELSARGNGWATKLQSLGVGPDVVVPLLSTRGIPLLSAMISVFKAGGAYLPLDPKHPPQRIAQILMQLPSPVVLVAEAQRELATAAAALLEHPVRIISFDELGSATAENLPTRARPGSLAYVIFTSGSTGAPKGAMVEQLGMINHLDAKVSELQMSSSDVVAQTASQCFDISVWQSFSALAVGGTTVILQDDIASSPRAINDAVAREKVTVLEVVPSVMSAMVEDDRSTLGQLRWLVATGEALPAELCRRWFEKYPAVPLLNAYGPTECSDDVTHHFMKSAPSSSVTPIGRALSHGVTLYVVDDQLNEVADGAEGELLVGGICVGRGYFGRPDLTAEKFVPDPHSKGARLYRTGDLVRRNSDGLLEFINRIDFQVKVRGYRIELGEIEAKLLAQPGVREAVVLAREDEPGNKQLVAYVVPREGAQLSVDALRAALASSLPEYMVPAALVPLAQFPLTTNGKVDRRALPAPQKAQPLTAAGPVIIEPRTPVEKRIAQQWMKIRKLKTLSVDTNLFDTGANSISLTQLAAKLSDMFEADVPPGDIFASPTVAAIGAIVERLLAEKAGPAKEGELLSPFRITPQPRPPGNELPLSFTEQRHFTWWQLANEPVAGRMNSIAVRLKGPFSVDALERATEQLVQRHELLRSTYKAKDLFNGVRVVHPKQLSPVRVVDLRGKPNAEAAAMSELETEFYRPLNLVETGPLRLALFRLEDERQLLYLAVDHIAADDVGFRAIFNDLKTFYGAAAASEPPPELPPLPSYADFAIWQRRLFSNEAFLAEQKAFWQEKLTAATPLTRALPTDFPRAPVDAAREKNHIQPFKFGAAFWNGRPGLRSALTEVTRARRATTVAATVAALAAVLNRRAKLSTLFVPFINDYRQRTFGMEGAPGSFNNTSLFRLSMEGRPTWTELIMRAQTELNDMFQRPEFPLIPVMFPKQTDLFRVVFNHMPDRGEPPRPWPGCELEPVAVRGASQYLKTMWDMMFLIGEGRTLGGAGAALGEGDSIGGALFFNGNLWNQDTANSIVKQLAEALARMADAPDAPIDLG